MMILLIFEIAFYTIYNYFSQVHSQGGRVMSEQRIRITADLIRFASHRNLFGDYPRFRMEELCANLTEHIIHTGKVPNTIKDNEGHEVDVKLGLCGAILREEVEIENPYEVAHAFTWKLLDIREGGASLCGCVLLYLGRKIKERELKVVNVLADKNNA